MAIPTAIGLDPIIANSVHRTINSTLGPVMKINLVDVRGTMFPPQIPDQDYLIWAFNYYHILQNNFATHVLVSGNNIEFLLIIAPAEESYKLAQSAFKVAEKLKVPLKVCVIWQTKASDGSKTALVPWTNFVDVNEAKTSSGSPSWWDLCGMTNKGAILVRPDEHIAWRAKTEIKSDPISLFTEVFCAILRL